ncbi:MAG: hypothetical protein K8R54_09500 [Bacteroidales bacterium]|nr:hypothetical protein [Bacteroidales bacterium]
MENSKKQKLHFEIINFYSFLNKRFLFILFINLLLFITSCTYSEYLSLDYELNRNETWNNKHTEIAFIASKKAYRLPTGMSRFPDGGTPEYLIKEVGLYVLNPEKKQLTEIINFNDLVEVIGTNRHRWVINLAFADTFIYYKITPNTEWKFWIDWARTADDSIQRCSMQKKYSKSYSVNIYNKKVVEIDSSFFSSIFLEYPKTNWIKYSKVDSMLTEIQAADWGLIVQNIWPKSDKEYINETIYLYNGSEMTRQAVTEQIISKLNKEEIEKLLKKMDRNYNKLKENDELGYFYEERFKIVYQRIKDLL